LKLLENGVRPGRIFTIWLPDFFTLDTSDDSR